MPLRKMVSYERTLTHPETKDAVDRSLTLQLFDPSPGPVPGNEPAEFAAPPAIQRDDPVPKPVVFVFAVWILKADDHNFKLRHKPVECPDQLLLQRQTGAVGFVGRKSRRQYQQRGRFGHEREIEE